jgi:hypothetical protein
MESREKVTLKYKGDHQGYRWGRVKKGGGIRKSYREINMIKVHYLCAQKWYNKNLQFLQ